MSARTIYLDPNLNTPHYPACCICGKKCNNVEFSVWSANYLEAVHPEDVELYNSTRGAESGLCALIPVGPECAKKIPQEFLVKNEVL
jgi:hypothetical protein